MKPPAAKIDWRRKDETIDMRVLEPPRRGDTGRAAANNNHFGIAASHPLRAPFGAPRLRKTAPSAVC